MSAVTKARSRVHHLGALLTSFGLLVLVGCQSTTTELPPQTTDQLVGLRNQLFTAKAQVQGASSAARDLVEQPRQDLVPQVEMLKKQVTALNDTRAQTRAQGEAFQQSASDYFAKWDQSIQGMSEETEWAGKRRVALAKESLAQLEQQTKEVRARVAPFMTSLNEATKYLSTDTTRAGLNVVEPQLRSALRGEKGILDGIDDLVATIDKIRAGK
jgi:hypothetical protein